MIFTFKKMRTSKKGFTLIELLVVIAIIGILASIVLVSFPQASRKAKDARVKSAVGQARTVMTAFQANTGSYKDFSTSSEGMPSLAQEVKNNSYNTTNLTIMVSADPYASSCMYVPLNEKSGATWYCADSDGLAGTTATDPGGAAGQCKAGSGMICPTGMGN